MNIEIKLFPDKKTHMKAIHKYVKKVFLERDGKTLTDEEATKQVPIIAGAVFIGKTGNVPSAIFVNIGKTGDIKHNPTMVAHEIYHGLWHSVSRHLYVQYQNNKLSYKEEAAKNMIDIIYLNLTTKQREYFDRISQIYKDNTGQISYEELTVHAMEILTKNFARLSSKQRNAIEKFLIKVGDTMGLYEQVEDILDFNYFVKDFNKLTVNQLRKKARLLDIPNSNNMNKAQLLKVIDNRISKKNLEL